MKSRIIRLLGISHREWPRVVSMSSLFALLMIGWVFGNSGREAFFVKKVGADSLPAMYILKSVLVIVFTAIYFQLVQIFPRYRFFTIQLVTFGITMAGLTLLIPTGYVWVPYAIYVFSEVFFEVLVFMQFWAVANDIFNPREGKRIFPLIGGTGLVGVIVGGLLTQPIATMIGTTNLMILWAVLMLAMVPLVDWVRESAYNVGAASAGRGRRPATTVFPVRGSREIWRVPLVRSMAMYSVPMWFAVYFIDYQFFVTMDAVIADPDRLAGLLGLLSSLVSLSGLLLQLFVTSRMLSRFGVGTTLLIHPVAMTVNALMLLFRSAIAPGPTRSLFSFRSLSAMFASYSDETLANSVGESAFELLYNALPAGNRSRCRAFVTGIIRPACTIAAGTTLILLVATGVNEIAISAFLFGCCVMWIGMTVKIRRDYLFGLVSNLKSHSHDLRDSAVAELSNLKDTSTTQILLNLLISREDEVALFALEILRKIGYANLSMRLCDVLPNTSSRLKVEILDILGEIEAEEGITAAQPLLTGQPPEVVAAAIRVVSKSGTVHDLDMIKVFLDHDNLDIRSEAVIAVIQLDTDGERHDRAFDILKSMSNASGPDVRAKAAYIIGVVHAKKLITLLIDLSDSREESVQAEVIKASAFANDEQIVPPLIKFFESDRLLRYVVDAIIHLGPVAVEPLQQLLHVPFMNDQVKKQMIKCLGKIGSAETVPILLDLIEGGASSVPVQLSAAEAIAVIKYGRSSGGGAAAITRTAVGRITALLRTNIDALRQDKTAVYALKNLQSDRAVFLLVDGLERNCQQRLDLILKFLEVLDDTSAIRTAAINLRGKDRRSRAEALEILEGSSREARDLVRVLEHDELPCSEREVLMDPTDIFNGILDADYNPWIHACTVFAIGELRLLEFKNRLLDLREQQDLDDTLSDSSLFYALSTPDRQMKREPIIRNNIHIALHKLGVEPQNREEKEVIEMSINMGRMLFLRRVPLFNDLEGSDLQFLSDICIEREYPAGDKIFSENDRGDALYIIESGRVSVVTGDCDPVTLAVLQERECFGEMSILDGEPRSASVVVQKDVKLLVITREDFHGILLARPKIAISLFRTLSIRLRETLNKLTSAERREMNKIDKSCEEETVAV